MTASLWLGRLPAVGQRLQLLGSIVHLMMHSPLHLNYPMAVFEERIVPSLLHGNFRDYERQGQPIGFVNRLCESGVVDPYHQAGICPRDLCLAIRRLGRGRSPVVSRVRGALRPRARYCGGFAPTGFSKRDPSQSPAHWLRWYGSHHRNLSPLGQTLEKLERFRANRLDRPYT